MHILSRIQSLIEAGESVKFKDKLLKNGIRRTPIQAESSKIVC
jgi:hypothetical protein